ncbi:MAG TPA: hypothetical protein VNG31_05320, partial [Candidatus Baltobacteraceae bacterium]|nr:hypothetical protein [Candidatus Baltobacteraceae bacterium]
SVSTAILAVLVWLLFHSIYADLSQAGAAVGYLDASAESAIFFAGLMMWVGTLALACTAAWAALHLARIWLRSRKRS